MATKKAKKLYIIDGHALCYRAYYAFQNNPLINSQGLNTSAIFGFARMFFKLIEDQKPDYLVVAFDPPTKSFRFDIYPEYKANRKKMPEDLKVQIEEIKNMVDALGIQKLEVDNYEADDVLGTVAKKYGTKELTVMLVTGDKDAYQLVNNHVQIYANKKGISEHVLYDIKGIEEKLGLKPEQVIDYMALMGDSSDNVPGVKGIGEKSAVKLISEYGSLEKLYENIDKLKGKQKELLENGKEMALLSKELVTIKTDVPIELDVKKLTGPEIQTEAAREFFRSLEMNSIIRDYLGGDADEPKEETHETIETDYKIIRTEKEMKALVTAIKKKGEIAIDTETTSISPVKADLVGISISIKEKAGYYIPLASKGLFSEDYLDREISLELIKPVIEDPEIKKIGQNIKYDFIVFRNAGIEMQGIYFDTMVASYVLTPTDRRHNLDDLAIKYLNYKTIKFKEIVGTGKNVIPITEVPLQDLAVYAIEDTDITYQLYTIFKKDLDTEKLGKLFFEVEMPLVTILADMEYAGVKISHKHFEQLSKLNEGKLNEVIEKIYAEAGDTFNINSTKELSEILFTRLGLKPQKKTKTGYSTDITVLEALRKDHPIIDHLILYRTLSKLKSTYIDTLPKLVYTKTDRIHASYNQTVAVTGRLSSSDPNLQNIPIRDDMGKEIRKGFVPEKDFQLMSADYSQIELRLTAHYSNDSSLIQAFKEGTDIHNLTASSVFGVSMDEVTSDMRRQSKIINFATIYGVSPYGLSQQAEIDIKEAAEFIKKYFETYPGVKEYIDTTIEFAGEHGYVTTMLGRKRKIPEIKSDSRLRREGAERTAINTPIQGTSADMIKLAMIAIKQEMDKQQYKSKMIMQVHDELVFEVHKDEKDTIEALVKEKMEKALELSIPVIVDIGWGSNWEEAH
ncbi:MAG: DNA polymerase I [bacterium]|nr:DNA polymerase I [bacterium]